MTVGFRQQFEKDLHQLKDHVLKKRILKAIHQAEQAPTLTDLSNLRKLSGYETYYRIRVGDYRLGLKWDSDENTLYFVTFAHRKDIYQDFP